MVVGGWEQLRGRGLVDPAFEGEQRPGRPAGEGRARPWGSLGLLAWTHVGYPLAAAGAARLRRYRARADEEYAPAVALVITAHNEESVIAERLENALRQDYPRERLDIVVASDGSTDGTAGTVASFAERGVRLLEPPRAARCRRRTRRWGDGRPTSWLSRTPTRSGSRTRSACSSAASRMPRSATSADAWMSTAPSRATAARASTGATSSGSASRSRPAARSPRATEASMPCGGRPSSSSAPSTATTSGCRFGSVGTASVPSTSPTPSLASPRLTTTRPRRAQGAHALAGWWEVLRGGPLDPRGQPPLYSCGPHAHRAIRYAGGPLHVLLFLASLRLAPRDEAAHLLALQLGFGALALLGPSPSRLARRRGLVPRGDDRCIARRPSARDAAARHARARPGGPSEPSPLRRLETSLRHRARGVRGVLASPVLGAIAAAIKLEGRGPILFRQERVGRHGRSFEILKFRTLVYAPTRDPSDYLLSRSDPRITRAFLRRWSLDELLPALERPARGHEHRRSSPDALLSVERYDDFQRRRLEVLLGVTGWAQIGGRNTLPWPERSSSTSGTSTTARSCSTCASSPRRR